MFCKNCGTELENNDSYCPKCGSNNDQNSNIRKLGGEMQYKHDSPQILWILISCCCPILGFFLYLTWRDTRPNAASSVKIGTIIGAVIIGLWIIFYIIFAIWLSAVNSSMTSY